MKIVNNNKGALSRLMIEILLIFLSLMLIHNLVPLFNNTNDVINTSNEKVLELDKCINE